MQRILKSYLFWTYPRGSFHYDVMVTLILVFLFVSPRLINYRDRPQETLTSTKDILVRANGPDAWTYQIGGSDKAIGGAGRKGSRFNPNLLNVGQESVVCSHALRGGDWVWLAQSLSPAG